LRSRVSSLKKKELTDAIMLLKESEGFSPAQLAAVNVSATASA
jgi:hypothetical protein